MAISKQKCGMNSVCTNTALFSSDIVRTISKENKYLTGFKRVGQWIDVGDGWVCWRLNTGNTLLLEPVTFVFHEKIKEMGAKLNIRSLPSGSSEILETVDSDAVFKAVAIKDNWLQINLTQTMKTYRRSKIAQVEGDSTVLSTVGSNRVAMLVLSNLKPENQIIPVMMILNMM